MPRLSISLLGTFQVLLDDQPVTSFESDKVRALLAYLAVESAQPHRRPTICRLCSPHLSVEPENWPKLRSIYRIPLVGC
jgi:hypothetical protein